MGKSKDLATLKNSGLTILDGGFNSKDAHSQLTLTDTDDNKFVLLSYSGGNLIVRNNSSSTTEDLFTLTESGNFGVGTISPSALMHLESDGPSIKLVDNNNDSDYEIKNGNGDLRVIDTTNSADRLKINSTGHLTTASQPKFMARPTNTTLTGNNSKQSLIMSSVIYETGGGYNSSTGQYTCPTAGAYFFFMNVRFDGISSSTYMRGMIYRGSSVPSSPWNAHGDVLQSINGDNHSTNYHTVSVSGILDCAANDVIHFLGGGHSDSSITMHSESNCGGFLLG